MYGSNTRGFAAAVITGGLIGVSGTSAGLRAVPPSAPLSPTPPEHRGPVEPSGRHDSESAVNRISSAETTEAGGRSVHVDFDQQAPRELAGRPAYEPGRRGASGGPGVQPGFPMAAGPRQAPSGGQQLPGDPRFGGGPLSPSDPAGPGGQQFGGQQFGDRLPPSDPRRPGFGAPAPSDQRSYPAARHPGQAGPLGPVDPGAPGARPDSGGPGFGAGRPDLSDAERRMPGEQYGPRADRPADPMGGPVRFAEPVEARGGGPRSVPEAGADRHSTDRSRPGSHHAVAGTAGFRTVADLVASTGGRRTVEGSGGRRARPELPEDFGGLRVVPDVTEYPGGPDVPGSAGHQPPAELSGAGGHRRAELPGSGGHRPAELPGTGPSSGRRRAVPESVGTGGHRAVRERAVEHRGEPGAGYRPVSDLSGVGGHQPLGEPVGAVGRLPFGEGTGGTALAAPPATDLMSGRLGAGEGRLRTGFDAYGQATPEVELGRLEPPSARSGMFLDRSVDSSLPIAAVASQRFTAGGADLTTGGYQAVESLPPVVEQHLAEPRRPRHDSVGSMHGGPMNVGPMGVESAHVESGQAGEVGHREKAGSALGSLDSSGLFGSLSSRRG